MSSRGLKHHNIGIDRKLLRLKFKKGSVGKSHMKRNDYQESVKGIFLIKKQVIVSIKRLKT